MDLNGDGVDDLLGTTNRADGRGGVLAYEVPSAGVRGNWTRHVLATGFKPQGWPTPGKGAPGRSQAFYPRSNVTAGKPWVLVSGDDSGL